MSGWRSQRHDLPVTAHHDAAGAAAGNDRDGRPPLPDLGGGTQLPLPPSRLAWPMSSAASDSLTLTSHGFSRSAPTSPGP